MISRRILYGLVGMCISTFGPVAIGTAFGQTADYVYVETNLNPANSIRVFSRAANGQLQEIAGSPFASGGAGSGYNGVAVGPDDSDQEIITNPDHSLLFAVNAASDSVSVFSPIIIIVPTSWAWGVWGKRFRKRNAGQALGWNSELTMMRCFSVVENWI